MPPKAHPLQRVGLFNRRTRAERGAQAMNSWHRAVTRPKNRFFPHIAHFPENATAQDAPAENLYATYLQVSRRSVARAGATCTGDADKGDSPMARPLRAVPANGDGPFLPEPRRFI